ncbi:hypothetical protein EC973_009313 [Apophysomyces ossiformis]|uniref:Raptor N-terminal CASPase-like domain-containing protein n=1 Tax=Apophysomyces ossiformis TaxID=679940 RepID=A0A8H7BSB8_9FUNG|nr:hypothetical protein EC973_009313 [Apophysomyces ossiformis]
MPTATQPSISDQNEDARSTSSTLVNGENSARNEVDVTQTQHTDERRSANQAATSPVRLGFDQDIYEEDIIRFLYFSEKRHDTNAKPNPAVQSALLDWKSLEAIGKHLHTQYETINGRTRFKLSLDPSVEETKKVCCQMRRNAKEERILFHYNGHGVPKPTASGEIWVFNRNYTQYIPVSLYDLQSWLGSPVIYVWDCSSAGNIINAFNRFAEKRDNDAVLMAQQHQSALPSSSWRDCIQLAACGPTETLPMNPDLPADVFTACLTTPIEMSLRWVVMRNPLLTSNITMDMVLRLPGRATERRTPLGELNWIFTAVTDTIAWCVLQDQPELFKRLFRQDLTVASMFRNFLLAERIMRSYQCTPMSTPKLPKTHDHPMWHAWDLAVDMCLFQLPAMLAAEAGGPAYQYQSSTFFAEQLTAFEVWLSEGAVNPKIPEQLPIVLQVLLSQIHRLRALLLLSRFLDLGPWAVNAALSVGIFPYVLKLLQSPAAELKPVLVFIWARILAVDRSCQNDLLKDHGYAYFINILTPNNAMRSIPNVSEHRAMCAFILSVFCTNFRMGQQACLRGNVISACLAHVRDPDPLLRQWVCLCLAQVWMNNSEAKSAAIAENGHELLCSMLHDNVPEVRASAMYALGTFLGDANITEQIVNIEHNIAISALVVMSDGSPIVRKEFVIALSHIVKLTGPARFLQAASQTIEEDQSQRSNFADERGRIGRSRQSDWRAAMDGHFGSTSYDSVYAVIWKALLNLSVDPHPDVANAASTVVDHINSMLLNNPSMGELATSLIRDTVQQATNDQTANLDRSQPFNTHEDRTSAGSPVRRPAMLTRSVSFASTLRTIYNFSNISSTSMHDTNNTSSRSHTDNPRVASPATVAQRNALRGNPPMDPQRNPTSQSDRTGHKSTMESVLPLTSEFYDWSCEYFTEPQIRAPEADEPGSVVYTQRKWRRARNEKILVESNSNRVATTTRWDNQVISVYNETEATHLLFHPYESHLVAADAYNCLVVWDWKAGTPLTVIDNRNPSHSRITDVRFINEDDVALLLTASDDGAVRLYKNYDGSEQEDAILVSAWRALKDMERSSSRQSGLVCEWHQGRGTLFTGGDARVIKVWDAHQEMSVMDIATQCTACVTSIVSDQIGGNIVIAGFGDGLIGVYDRRMRSNSALVQRWDEHKSWITGIHLQRDGNRELISGGFGGDIKTWDLREPNSLRTIDAHTHANMTALAFHDQSQTIASAGDDQVIKIWDLNGTRLSTIRPSSGFLGQRNSFTRALAFHPNYRIMAASGDDGYITVRS